jgi:hypothetical protein
MSSTVLALRSSRRLSRVDLVPSISWLIRACGVSVVITVCCLFLKRALL